jgi:hypothetical protein
VTDQTLTAILGRYARRFLAGRGTGLLILAAGIAWLFAIITVALVALGALGLPPPVG